MNQIWLLDRSVFQIIHGWSGDRTIDSIFLGITQSGLAHIQGGALLTIWSQHSTKAWVKSLVPLSFVAVVLAVGVDDSLALNHILVFLIFVSACYRVPLRAIKAGLIGFTIGGLLNLLVKFLLLSGHRRERPSNFFWAHPLENVYLSESFPSGHTCSSAGLAFPIAIMMPWTKIGYVFIIWGILVGISRTYVGVHFPSDVLAGYGFGLVAAGLTKWLIVRGEAKLKPEGVE